MNKIFFTLFFSFVFSFGLFTHFVSAATTPSLGVASTFSVLTHTFTSTTIPYGANIFGDLGYATTTGVSVGVFGGVTHVNDATYLQAGLDQHTALAALNSQACTFSFVGAVDLATDISHGPLGVYTPGVYCSSGPMSIGGAGTITLDGAGTYIFRPIGALTTSDFSIATTTNGASPCDVFWTPKWPTPSVATALGLDTRFVGTVIEPVAAANSNITVGGGTKWVGRALAFDWSVITNPVIMKYVSITAPTCPVPPPPTPTTATLHIIKHVVNNDGGTATASSFTLHVKGTTGMGVSDVAGSPAVGVEAPGTTYTLDAGTYIVSENAFSGYTGSISGDCDANGNITLSSGGNAICTITNDDIAIPVIVPPVIHITKIPTPLALPLGAGPVTYDYTVTNIGTVAMTNVTVTDNKCAPAIFISGDTNADTKLDVSETWKYRCTATLATTTTNTVIVTGHGNSFTVTDTADATVIVSVPPVVPPVVTPPTVIPKLPKTGLATQESNNSWNITALAVIFLSVTSGLYFAKRKHI